MGPAVADIEAAFAQIWAAAGEAFGPDETPDRASMLPAGDVALRVVASAPTRAVSTASINRLRRWHGSLYG